MTQAMALEDTTWTEEAVATIADLARRGGTVTADDLRRHHRPAPHPNKVGSAFKIARSRGLIQQAGISTSKQRSRHGGGPPRMGGGMSTFYTVPEVAQMFRVCEETVRRRVRANKWPAWRDGTQIRFGEDDIDAIRRQGAKHPAPAKADRRARNKQLRKLPVFAQ